ncbi:MAG: hypothetical protein AAFN43_06300 [Pseudomonadota bacterium]
MVFHAPNWLLPAYVANIAILVPVCWSLFASGSVAGVFEGRVAESDGLRLLVASLYLAILAASVGGLFFPVFFAPLLLLQVFYKACWLLVFILPLYLSGEPLPTGISVTFIIIVVSYPVLFLLAK